ncbi:MAG TPA: Pls/PosA family non-ribosomal peptide synthetase [Trebonia sp.]|nr:Pls/PosA family non-ribosomal peptide synthetase [Trebonia sp.]
MVLDVGVGGKILTAPGDNRIRWQAGERLADLYEASCDDLRRSGRGGVLAVDGPAGRLTYDELDAAANQVARFLIRTLGVRPGDRVSLLFDDAVDGYVCMLGALKAHAVYVPLDPGFPPERISYIVSDAAVRVVLSHSRLAGLVAADETGGPDVVYVDQVARLSAESGARLTADETGPPGDDLCYVIYTSGTTGRPKGVAVSHPSICNFVRVAAETYGYTAADRVYQGLTMAFDFAIEETWVPWLAGATLVPKPRGANLLGSDLAGFLREQGVTALCCVPTLLATLDDDLPGLRFLLVSGEPCPRELADRWHRPGRRFLNVYGPTEATVSATWTVLEPGRPVTIGVPLPTYSVVILDPGADRLLMPGQAGEIGIAGIGLADGYLNLPDRTSQAFVPDFAGMPHNPSGRIYRTGDLGRVGVQGEIEHLGRIDTQVKIRGYRIELAEIESLLAEVPGVAQAVVTTHESAPGVVELAAYYRLRREASPADAGHLYERLRERLPGYMVPAYLEEIAEIPVTAGGKADRRSLPPPSGPRRQAARRAYRAPAAGTETLLADALAGVLGLDQVSADADFFDELGASSLLMARFAAALPDGSTASMREIYLNRTVGRLAAVIDGARDEGAYRLPAEPEALDVGERRPGRPRYALCGALQLLAFCCLIGLTAAVLGFGSSWMSEANRAEDVLERAVVFGAALQACLAVLPVAAKWALIGRWKPRRITIWSLAYVRFWVVKSLLVASPLALLSVGTPLYSLYLRALGAKVGRGAVLFTGHVPVCTDLLTIGPGAVIRKGCYLNGYRARAGVIEIGPVTLGEDVFVGEQTVLDIGTVIGDGAQLGHASSLHAGQAVPPGACWHGSPARPAGTGHDYRPAGTAHCGRLRRACYGGVRLASILFIAGPLEAAAGVLLWSRPRILSGVPELDSVAAAAVLFACLIVAGLIIAGTVPRLLTRLLTPGKTYPLYGVHFTIQRLLSGWSNFPAFHLLFGDSVLITGYLRLLGYRLGKVEQTGSNFGTTLRHEVPALSEIGTGTMVSDGLSMMNADFSSSAFRVVPVTVGPRNFLGNDLAWPPGARTGENCLIATKAMVPVTGPVRENAGVLGSPSFEIPRSVPRDRRFDELGTEPERHRRIAAKTRHNLVTIALHLLVRFALLCSFFAVALLPVTSRGWPGLAGTAGLIAADLTVLIIAFVVADRAVTGFRPLRPRFCSIYQLPFWRHERYWKVPSVTFMRIFDGTPFKPVAWRLLGVQMGRRVFDDGCAISERSLVSVGDGATLNMACLLQSHSLEDGVFKSDRITIGRGCTIGTGALVHYAVTMAEGSLLEADSFAMKGSDIRPGARWLGNPATQGGQHGDLR